MAHGPEAGLARLDTLAGLEMYGPYHAMHADLLRRLGQTSAARCAYLRARELTNDPAERDFFDARLAGLVESGRRPRQ